jgi:hypothetical protein
MDLLGQRRSCVELPAATKLSLGAGFASLGGPLAPSKQPSLRMLSDGVLLEWWPSCGTATRTPPSAGHTPSLGRHYARARALADSLEVATGVPKRPIMHQKASHDALFVGALLGAPKLNLLGE